MLAINDDPSLGESSMMYANKLTWQNSQWENFYCGSKLTNFSSSTVSQLISSLYYFIIEYFDEYYVLYATVDVRDGRLTISESRN